MNLAHHGLSNDGKLHFHGLDRRDELPVLGKKEGRLLKGVEKRVEYQAKGTLCEALVLEDCTAI